MKNILLLIIIVSASSNAFQSEKDTVYNYKTGKVFFEKAFYDSALFYFEKAAAYFENENLWELFVEVQNHIICSLRETGKDDSALVVARFTLETAEFKLGKQSKGYARTLNETGRLHNKKGQYQEALQFAYASMESLINYPESVEMSENYSLLGVIFRQTGDYDSAFIYYNRSIQLKKELVGETHYSIGVIYNNIAYAFAEKGDFLRSGEYYIKSLHTLINSIGEDHRDIPKIYKNIGANYFYRGENELALEYYYKAVNAEKEFLNPDHVNFGFSYNNIAMALRVNKEYDKAMDYSNRAIDIFRKNLGEEHPNYAGVINNIGRIYFDMQGYEKALESYQTAYSILKNRFGEKHPTVPQTLNNIAEVFYQKGDFINALLNSNEALRIRVDLFGENHPKVAESCRLNGDIYFKAKNPDSALHFYQQALVILTDDFHSLDPKSNPELRGIYSKRNILSIISLKARVFLDKYNENSNPDDLISSFGAYQICGELISDLRRDFKTEAAKLSAEENIHAIFTNGIIVCEKLFNITKNKAYIEKAFEFAEKSKAAVLLDALNEANAKKFSGIPDSLLEYERRLKIDLSFYETQIQKEKEKRSTIDSVKLKLWEDTFFTLNRNYEELLNFFEKNYPEYYNLRYSIKLLTLAEIQNDFLSGNNAVIEYVHGGNSIIIFLLKKNHLSLKVLALENDLDELVKEFRVSLHNLDFNSYIESAYKLYSVLLLPIEQELYDIHSVNIIPDGILNYLPFEALLINKKSYNYDFSKLDYVLNRFEINYYFSVNALNERKTKTSLANGFVGFAPVFSNDFQTQSKIASIIDTSISGINTRVVKDGGKIYSSLPETEKEIIQIAGLYRAQNINAHTFTHSLAKKGVIKSDYIKNYNVIHLASHGFINEINPKLSGILFWFDDNDEVENGILYSNEIYNLNLNADLIVLSACETGLGKIVKGEGIIGLTRGFVYSGARNVVVSLWQVADKSTSDLMIEFYKNVLNGEGYSSALREAKLKLIKNVLYSYPMEWSPFVLVGN